MTFMLATSDTHRRVNKWLGPPPRDDVVLIHCGDAMMQGNNEEFMEFLDWFHCLPAKHKLYVPGNHDFICEEQYHYAQEMCQSHGIQMLDGRMIEIDGVTFYGAPWVTRLKRWAFNRDEDWIYDRIKGDIGEQRLDVLISHSPAYGVLDEVGDRYALSGESVGSHALSKIVAEYSPVLHFHGHIHEGYGTALNGMTTVHNVSMCDEMYAQINPAMLERM